MMNGFMYGNIFEDEERFQRQAIFPKLLCQNAEDFSYVSRGFSLSTPPLLPSPLPFTAYLSSSSLTSAGFNIHRPPASSVPGPVWAIKIEVNELRSCPQAAHCVRRETPRQHVVFLRSWHFLFSWSDPSSSKTRDSLSTPPTTTTTMCQTGPCPRAYFHQPF